ncbi:CutA1 divalent ion tolerance protein [Candidatus Koribacter versatilis Ellin345]|uniref:CutA1 divalent ion tolerance protein n=1 Tax=Koribacter versatilis (strain Ellin345) TaxID=204669 RepID=Q1IQU9_KORVE|nr:divalent-cation tolerance protein CutA [Candidatus Koribacter versatilis]ABF40751.1 CutA1 divalent ion tolerance protein [Candidatus Koribacter versatilis Ellin345]
MTDARIILTTVAVHETAMSIAQTLVQEKLAACVNVAPAVESIYWWQGKMDHSLEYVLTIKTAAGKVDALRERLLKLHPYEVPEFVVLAVESGSEAYLGWIRESVS